MPGYKVRKVDIVSVETKGPLVVKAIAWVEGDSYDQETEEALKKAITEQLSILEAKK